MSKKFNTLYLAPVFHTNTVAPSDVGSITAQLAAHLACRSIKPNDAGLGVARAIVEACYGTPHTKALICADKRSATARTLAQAWPKGLPSCNNSKDASKRRLLTVAEFKAAWNILALAFDTAMADRAADAAKTKAVTANPADAAKTKAVTANPADAAKTKIDDAASAILVADATTTLSLFKGMLYEALACKGKLPNALKERMRLAIAA